MNEKRIKLRLKHITFTGVDAKTNLKVLDKIQKKYPMAEFGVLTSYHWYENGNRYLDPSMIGNLGDNLNLARMYVASWLIMQRPGGGGHWIFIWTDN